MNPFKLSRTKENGPERKIQNAITDFLKSAIGAVKTRMEMSINFGFPDLYACHRKYGARWIEVKNPENYSFTPAQLETFPMFVAHGAGVWILVAATEEEYQKLFKPCNWYQFLKL